MPQKMNTKLLVIFLIWDLVLGNPEEIDNMDYQEDYPDHIPRNDIEYSDHFNDDHGHHDHFEEDLHPHPLNEGLTTEAEAYHQKINNDSDIYKRKISRMLTILGRGLLTTEKDISVHDHHYLDMDQDYHMDQDFDYEIEDRIVRYAMNKYHEEI